MFDAARIGIHNGLASDVLHYNNVIDDQTFPPLPRLIC